jgi:hypothetical protein
MTVSLTSGGSFKGTSFVASTEPSAYGLKNQSDLYLPLQDILIPARGSSTPTFTRATAASFFDNEGKLNTNIPSDCARFTGARFVRNRVATTSATLAVAATNTVTLARSETVTFSMGAGTGTATFSGTSGATGTLTASAGGRTEVTKTCTAGTFIITASVATLVDIQVEVVSGQADQTASEYVSVGVLSAPFHGAGVDGCKYFTTNKDGSAIPAATLLGYDPEPSRVNNCLWSRDQRGQTAFGTVKPWIPSIVGSELITNGGLDSDTTWVKGSGWSIGSGVATKTAGVASDLSQTISVVSGNSYVITYTLTRTAGNLFIRVGGSSGNLYVSPTTNGTYTTCVIAAGGSSTFYFGADAAFAGTIDNVSVKEAAIQVTTTTGLDNVANSASLLTAAANDATLLQLLTAPTGSRTASVWIKRVSGSGTVSLTRNGGTGWTDITSSLVTGTWVPVELTSDVGANPTVGLKMGTSGDVIDVDCFQDENGAWRTSPILTTTAAVTRNADVLSYASAFDVAQGTALCSLRSDSPSGTSDIYALGGDSSNARLMYWNIGANRNTGAIFDGTTAASSTGSSINTGIRKRASRWGADLRMCADGTLGTAEAFDGSMGASTTLYVGCNQAGADQLSGNIGEVHIWNAPLTDAQMQQVTS